MNRETSDGTLLTRKQADEFYDEMEELDLRVAIAECTSAVVFQGLQVRLPKGISEVGPVMLGKVRGAEFGRMVP